MKKEKFNPDRKYINDAMEEFFAKGGRIKKVDSVEFTDDTDDLDSFLLPEIDQPMPFVSCTFDSKSPIIDYLNQQCSEIMHTGE